MTPKMNPKRRSNREPLACSICGEQIKPHPISGYAGGNNAEPVNNGRCCDDCNGFYVIPARIVQMYRQDKK
jgi:hypothetical protein